MMFKCESCGNLFEEGEQATWEERHGLDSPPYEQWSGCPICKGGYEEVHQCKECGDWHTEDISIHALREEGDSKNREKILCFCLIIHLPAQIAKRCL